ncbi:MAG: gliding motility-associated C-terminal domain-containing protein [Chitinophagaceae bacterium]|nr:gliding motility-associated C-terminal domain-containing protein [Chitinophagaceae bacterium]
MKKNSIFNLYHMNMKRIITILLIVLPFLFAEKVNATHLAGGELLYRKDPISGGYFFTLKIYRDCGTATQSTSNALATTASVDIGVINGCGITTPICVTLGKISPPNGTVVNPGCPGYTTTCTDPNSTLRGFQEYIYENAFAYQLPGGPCASWKFYFSMAARNNAILNLQNPGGQNLYIEAELNNTIVSVLPVNNSPTFTNVPIPYACVNQPYAFNNGAFDVDGDSLVYSSIQPRTGGGCPSAANPLVIAYNPVTNTPANPFPTLGPNFNVDPNSGALTFTPTNTGFFVVSLLVDEYRNGVKIGSVMRDIQFVIDNCNQPSPVTAIDTFNISGGGMVGGVVQGCAGQTLNFCADIKSPSPNAVLVGTSNIATTIPGATLTFTNLTNDSVRLCVTWPTTLADVGLHTFTVTMKDSFCAPPGILLTQVFTYSININDSTHAFQDDTICEGDQVQLNAINGSTFNWSVVPGGSSAATLSCTPCPNPIVTPTVTTYYTVESNLAAFCGNAGRDTVKITVAVGPQIDIVPNNPTTCVNASLQLDVNVNPPGSYTYSWTGTGAANLNNTTIKNPLLIKPNPAGNSVQLIVQVTPSGITLCSTKDTIDVDIIKGYTLNAYDNVLCDGESTAITGTGDPRYNYTWSPATFLTSTNTINTIANPAPPGTYNYSLTATFPGCPDSVTAVSIIVDPLPIVNAGLDREFCRGDTIHLASSVVPPANYTIQWAPVGDLDDPTKADPVFDGVQSTLLSVIYTSPNGCKDTDDVFVNVLNVDFLNVNGDRSLCPRDSATLTAAGGISYYWQPNYYISSVTGNSVVVKPPVTTTYTVIGVDVKGCQDTGKATVQIHPDGLLDAGEDKTIYPGESVELNASGNCLIVNWFPPYGLSNPNLVNPIAMPGVTTKYILTGETEFGCETIDSVTVFVSPETLLDLPNSFTPGGGTSMNDQLKIIKRGLAELTAFKIYNRWGEQVFSTVDINEGWNGQYNGKPQPLGVYVYYIEAKTSTGKPFWKQGNITLLR